MKISIGTKIKKNQAWGGGNNFAINLSNYLLKKGHEIHHDLKCKDLDIILITDPRKKSLSSSFDDIDVKNYLKNVNSKTLVIHRVNECDERKNTDYVNKELLKANQVADFTVYISNWLRKSLILSGFSKKNNSVILNGADKSLFKFSKNHWKKGPLKIVTHHWSNHPNKGSEIYKLLDNLLHENYWKKKIQFTYIGNPPKDVNFKNTKIIKPLYGKKLAKQLSECHAYITGSLNEPAGMHHIEAACCGLPIMYYKSGAIPEYCNKFGISISKKRFATKLKLFIKSYKGLKIRIKKYPYNSDKTCQEYLKLFTKLKKKKKNILLKRKIYEFSFSEKLKILKRKIKK